MTLIEASSTASAQQHLNIPATAPLPQHSNTHWLPMKLISCNGGQYNQGYRAENMLKPDSTVYCTTRRRNVKLILSLDATTPNTTTSTTTNTNTTTTSGLVSRVNHEVSNSQQQQVRSPLRTLWRQPPEPQSADLPISTSQYFSSRLNRFLQQQQQHLSNESSSSSSSSSPSSSSSDDRLTSTSTTATTATTTTTSATRRRLSRGMAIRAGNSHRMRRSRDFFSMVSGVEAEDIDIDDNDNDNDDDDDDVDDEFDEYEVQLDDDDDEEAAEEEAQIRNRRITNNNDSDSDRDSGSNHFVITHVLVKAPETGFTSPIGTGSIYVYDTLTEAMSSPSSAPPSTTFSASSSDTANTLMDSVSRRNLNPPVCHFSLQDKNYCTLVPLQTPRWGKYIVIYLTSPRTGSEGNNMDVQYIGFKGFVGTHSFAQGTLL